MNLQPVFENELIKIRPLTAGDFGELYEVASDPHIWEQHPDKDRCERKVFRKFFDGAIESKGAFIIFDNKTGKTIGSSRYYEYNNKESSVAIGYTFIAKEYWGGAYNLALKTLMLDHAFKFVDRVIFHIGSKNIRSQKSVEKLGAVKTEEIRDEKAAGERKILFVFRLSKNDWLKLNERPAN